MRIVYTGTSCCTGKTIIPSNLSYVQRNSEIWSIHANPRETKSGRRGQVFFSEGCKMVH